MREGRYVSYALLSRCRPFAPKLHSTLVQTPLITTHLGADCCAKPLPLYLQPPPTMPIPNTSPASGLPLESSLTSTVATLRSPTPRLPNPTSPHPMPFPPNQPHTLTPAHPTALPPPLTHKQAAARAQLHQDGRHALAAQLLRCRHNLFVSVGGHACSGWGVVGVGGWRLLRCSYSLFARGVGIPAVGGSGG